MYHKRDVILLLKIYFHFQTNRQGYKNFQLFIYANELDTFNHAGRNKAFYWCLSSPTVCLFVAFHRIFINKSQTVKKVALLGHVLAAMRIYI